MRDRRLTRRTFLAGAAGASAALEDRPVVRDGV